MEPDQGLTDARPAGERGWWWRVGIAVARRPWLWATALTQLFVLAAPGWWRRWPPVPAPDPGYLRFRLVTQYGRADADPDVPDVLEYLRWCRQMHAAER